VNKTTIQTIEERSGGLCESCNRPAQDAAHITNKGLGGRHGAMKAKINDPRNLAALCRDCHDLLHFKRKETYEGERLGTLQKLKFITGWEEWNRESAI
jgi:hypothetical protein